MLIPYFPRKKGQAGIPICFNLKSVKDNRDEEFNEHKHAKKIKQERLKNNNKTKHGKYISIINVTCVTALAKPQLPVADSNKQKRIINTTRCRTLLSLSIVMKATLNLFLLSSAFVFVCRLMGNRTARIIKFRSTTKERSTIYLLVSGNNLFDVNLC